jgi:two-component system chemotaxis sensor kinase CheA
MSIELQDLVRRLSEGVVLANPDDVEAIAPLHALCEQIAVATTETGPAVVTAAAAAGVKRLEQVLLREPANLDDAMREVARIVSGIQAIICEGRPLDEVRFPDEVQTAKPAPAAAPAATPSPAPAAGQKQPDPVESIPPFPISGDSDLLGEFINESKEHLDGVDVHLLTIESNAGDPEAVNAVFRAFHTIKGVAGFLELKPIQALAHEAETLLDKCRKQALTLTGDVLDVVFDAADAMKALIVAVEQAMGGDRLLHTPASQAGLLTRIVAIAEGRQAPAKAGPAPVVVAAAPSAAPADAAAAAHPAAGDAAADKIPADGDHAKAKTGPAVKDTVRVDSERLDKLVDTIGEMVIAEAMVSQSAEWGGKGSTPLARMLNHLDKITRELQELAMSLRMVPVKSAFQRMAKLARDVSKKLDKQIEFVTAGEDTELDKNVVDAVGDPLVHMVRNAVDHGLESSVEQRRAAGKPDAGRVELRAFHKGGSIYIEIEDDGRGIDREVVLAKARERGLIKENETLTESEVYALVFEPGFSTAKTITDVSGRGVGLDVVKRNIAALRGKVEIRSEKGKGTVFSIRLPLTLAIIEGMVVRVGSQRFVVPTLSILRMIRPGEVDLSSVFETGQMLKLEDRLIPLFHLNELFDIADGITNPCEAAVVVVEHDNRQIGFVVDELLGQQQIVIKPLGVMLRKYQGFCGGAIMPDGRVGLILDVASLTGLAGRTEEQRRAA